MPAFVVVEIEIHDPETYAEYIKVAPASIAKYDGRYVLRGGNVKTLEGTWSPGRFVILEFPTAARAQEWWDSPEYAGPKAMRQQSAHTEMILVDGPSFDPRVK